MPAVTRPVFGAEPRELSLLFVLFYIAASGNETNPGTFERNFNTRGRRADVPLRGRRGADRRARRRSSLNVVFNAPVRRIEQTRQRRSRSIADGRTVRAKRAIVAIPPTLAGPDRLLPALPAARDQLTQRLGQGTLTKVTAVYDTPFWRAQG